MYESEIWTLSKNDENTFAIWGKKIQRKTLHPVKENSVWRIHTNQQLMTLCREPNIISEIRKGRRRWL
jgi:hypothetical protein